MANASDYKEINAPSKGVRERIEVEYDFSKDGGAVGVIDLLKALEKVIILRTYFKVDTTFTSGGSATLEVGIKGGDTDALIAATAVASLAANAVIDEDSAGRNLVVAKDAIISAEIKVAAMTAGKGQLVVEYVEF